MYICIYIYIYTHIYAHIYIYIYILGPVVCFCERNRFGLSPQQLAKAKNTSQERRRQIIRRAPNNMVPGRHIFRRARRMIWHPSVIILGTRRIIWHAGVKLCDTRPIIYHLATIWLFARLIRQAFGLGRIRSRVKSISPILFIVYGFTTFIPHGGHLGQEREGSESTTLQPWSIVMALE